MAYRVALFVLATLAAQGEAAFQRTHDSIALVRPAGGSQPSGVKSAAAPKSLDSGHVNHTHLVARARAGDCGRPEVAAMLASMAIFDSGMAYAFIPQAQVNELKQKLGSAGFQQAKRWDISIGNCTISSGNVVPDRDAAVLWKRDEQCLLAFRGSNCASGDSFTASPASMFKYGYDINRDHLVHEFEPLVNEMKAADFADCSELHVTGFSMGGALATIFAVLNNDADQLNLGTTVTELYAMAPVPMFYGDRVGNKKGGGDECFAGGVYCNYVTQQGASKVDPACVAPGYAFPKTDFVKLGAATGDTACASVTQNVVQHPAASTLFPAHFPQLYLNSLGCAEAEVSFNSKKACKALGPWCR